MTNGLLGNGQEFPRNQPRSDLFPPRHWEMYRRVIQDAKAHCIPFALGGALAIARYTGQWRFTKDLDLYVKPSDRERMIAVLSNAGLADYYDTLPYSRVWIYRGNVDDIIVDVIWGMPNERAEVDDEWLNRATDIEISGEEIKVLPPEEMIFAKLYVLQHERCDWPDILNLLHATGPHLDWAHLLDRVGNDEQLLASLLSLFEWLDPECARTFPGWLWERLHLAAPDPNASHEIVEERAHLVDTRPWFLPTTAA